jgi:hypothetical protein
MCRGVEGSGTSLSPSRRCFPPVCVMERRNTWPVEESEPLSVESRSVQRFVLGGSNRLGMSG